MKTNNYIYIILLVVSLFSFGSCEKWLQVNPKTQISSDELFLSEDGFREALAGIYTRISQPDLYGREMSFGLVGAVAQEWIGNQIISANGEYFPALTFNYQEQRLIVKIESVFYGLYNSIANTNSILENLEKHKSVLPDLSYRIYKGEALALRAYLHLDILRLFADRDFSLKAKEVLPYVVTAKPEITKSFNPLAFIGNIISDLNEAKVLLQEDPINKTSAVDNSTYGNRLFHINYYGVEALLARAYMYKGDTQEALKSANKLIAAQNNGLFKWVSSTDVTIANPNLADRTFSSEHIFALNVTKMKDNIDGYLKNTPNPLLSRLEVSVFGTPDSRFSENGDYRRRFYEQDNGIADVPSKFWQMDAQTINAVRISPKKHRMPLVKISEMYYIAIECQKESNFNEAKRLLRVVYDNRNLTEATQDPTNADALQEALLHEYERDFIGEGQLFYYHKRINTPVIFYFPAKYTFPIPELENILGNR